MSAQEQRLQDERDRARDQELGGLSPDPNRPPSLEDGTNLDDEQSPDSEHDEPARSDRMPSSE